MVLNGQRPLDLAAERDSRVSVEGDVHLVMTLPKTLPLKTASQGRPNPWQRVSVYFYFHAKSGFFLQISTL